MNIDMNIVDFSVGKCYNDNRKAEVKRMCITEYDEQRTFALQRDEGHAEGRAEGLAEGRAEGRAEERAALEAKLRAKGMSDEEIKSLLE